VDYSFSSVESSSGYLHIRVRGDNVPPVITRYLREAYEVCRESQCPNVLIEEFLEGPTLSVTEVFFLVSKNLNVFPVVQRVAFVDANPAHDPARMDFAETVAVNRGLQMRHFSTVAEAVAWIESELAGSHFSRK
jgi:hypothetical protein